MLPDRTRDGLSREETGLTRAEWELLMSFRARNDAPRIFINTDRRAAAAAGGNHGTEHRPDAAPH